MYDVLSCIVFEGYLCSKIVLVLLIGAFAVYLEPWHADVFDFLDLRKNHGKVWFTGLKYLTSHEATVFLHLLQNYSY